MKLFLFEMMSVLASILFGIWQEDFIAAAFMLLVITATAMGAGVFK